MNTGLGRPRLTFISLPRVLIREPHAVDEQSGNPHHGQKRRPENLNDGVVAEASEEYE